MSGLLEVLCGKHPQTREPQTREHLRSNPGGGVYFFMYDFLVVIVLVRFPRSIRLMTALTFKFGPEKKCLVHAMQTSISKLEVRFTPHPTNI